MKNIYFTAAGLMGIFALVMCYARGWLWLLALLGASVALVFLGLSSGQQGGDE